MPLLQPSFRGRLRLFFAVIVVVPMIAVGLVLFQLLDAGDNFKLDSTLVEAQKGAQNLYTEARGQAMAAAAPIQRDGTLASAIKNEDTVAVQRRLEALDQQIGAQRIELVVDGLGDLRDRLEGRDRGRPRASCRTPTGSRSAGSRSR